MELMPGDPRPASLTTRRLHDQELDVAVLPGECACTYLVLLQLDETLDELLVATLMCPECGKHWLRGPGHSRGSELSPSLRSEATPHLWEQRRGSSSEST